MHEFDTIILLPGAVEQSALPAERARLIGVATTEIVQENILKRLGYGAFGGDHFGMLPTINLDGIQFRAVTPSSCQTDSARFDKCLS